MSRACDQRQVGRYVLQGLLCQPCKSDRFQIIAIHADFAGREYATVGQQLCQAIAQGLVVRATTAKIQLLRVCAVGLDAGGDADAT